MMRTTRTSITGTHPIQSHRVVNVRAGHTECGTGNYRITKSSIDKFHTVEKSTKSNSATVNRLQPLQNDP